jgi:hypothetical protein
MDTGEWVKGMDSALWIRAVPGLRSGTFWQACLRPVTPARLSFALLQELSKERVIEFVTAASRAYQQSFVA